MTTEFIEYNKLPINLNLTNTNFDVLWELRPTENQYVVIFGKQIKAPRKYKVYGAEYSFNGNRNNQEENPIPLLVQPYLDYINSFDDITYNSLLINWYENDNYVGFHSDNEKGLSKTADIYGISFGEKRTMRFKNDNEKIDYILEDNSIIKMKNGCQEKYKHSILKSTKLTGKRISLTFRCIKK